MNTHLEAKIKLLFMELTYFGHSCFLIESEGVKVLFDPFISPNPLAQDIDVMDIECDFVAITHAHVDHTADAEIILKHTGAKLIANWEIVEHYKSLGIDNCHAMNIGGKYKFDFGTLKMVHAVHSSSFPDGSYGGNPCGFIVYTKENTFYYAGDTALYYNMRQISDFGQVDFAVLPIGDNYTMGIGEAMMAADYVNTDKVIGVHYNTFPEITIDLEEAQLLAEGSQKELILLDIGEKLSIE